MWNLISIKNASEELKISRVTLYKKLKSNWIKPIKKNGNISYITFSDFQLIKNNGKSENNSALEQSSNEQVDFYKKQFELLMIKNDSLSQENWNLKLEVWKWQWRAEAFQQQVLLLQDYSKQPQIIYDTKKQASFLSTIKNFFTRS